MYSKAQLNLRQLFAGIILVTLAGLFVTQAPQVFAQSPSAEAQAIAAHTEATIEAIAKQAGRTDQEAQAAGFAAKTEVLSVYSVTYANEKGKGKTNAQAEKSAIAAATKSSQELITAATQAAGGGGGSSPKNPKNVQPTNTTTNGDKGGFVPCGNTADNPCQIGHLFSAFVVIINYLIAMAGFVAVAAIVFAGFTMIYSQGQEQLKEAKGRFSGAVIGLVLVALAFVLINALFTGSLSVGVRDGANILANPLEYISK